MENITHIPLDRYDLSLVRPQKVHSLVIFMADAASVGTPHGGLGAQLTLAQGRGYAALVVAPKQACWYQDADQLWATIADLAQGFRQVLAVGSEMGSVGVARLSAHVTLSEAMLFSPVAELDPRKGPQDWRFDDAFAAAGRFDPLPHINAGHVTVFYDAGGPERRQAAALPVARDKLTCCPMPGTEGRAFQIVSQFPIWDHLLNARLRRAPLPQLGMVLRDLRRATPIYLETLLLRNAHSRPGVANWALERLQEVGIRPRRLRRLRRALANAA